MPALRLPQREDHKDQAGPASKSQQGAQADGGIGEDAAGNSRVAAAAATSTESQHDSQRPENQAERRDEAVDADPVGTGGLGVAQVDFLGERRVVLRGEPASA